MFRFAALTGVVLVGLHGGNAWADPVSELAACVSTCSDECRELVRRVEMTLELFEDQCPVPEPRVPDRQRSDHGPGALVEIFHSDSCRGSPIATVDARTDCRPFPFTGTEAWGVRFDGQCRNIRDTSLQQACTTFKAAGRPDRVEILHSDRCSTSATVLAFVGPHTRCGELPTNGSDAWGVRASGECLNITDTSIAEACVRFQGMGSRKGLEIFHSDRCSGAALAMVSPRTDCGALEATGTDAWAVRQGGRCLNITDTSEVAACHRFKAAGSPGAVEIFHSDSCRDGSILAIVDRRTDCSALSATGSAAWGVEVGGTCHNVSDTSLADACIRYRAGLP
jgi:hypothetical protein